MASSLINELIAGRFSKLSGLHVSGTVPLQQDLVNEALAELVQSWLEPKQQQREKTDFAPTQFLTLVRKLQIRAEHGVVHVDFEIGV